MPAEPTRPPTILPGPGGLGEEGGRLPREELGGRDVAANRSSAGVRRKGRPGRLAASCPAGPNDEELARRAKSGENPANHRLRGSGHAEARSGRDGVRAVGA